MLDLGEGIEEEEDGEGGEGKVVIDECLEKKELEKCREWNRRTMAIIYIMRGSHALDYIG